MSVQGDLLKEIGKIREEFQDMTFKMSENKENQNQINQQVTILNNLKSSYKFPNQNKIKNLTAISIIVWSSRF